MKSCVFPNPNLEEYDRICTMEILPAITKAYGSIATGHNAINDALLIAGTERLVETITEYCKMMRDMYLWGQPENAVERSVQHLRNMWANRDTCSARCQELSHTENQTAES